MAVAKFIDTDRTHANFFKPFSMFSAQAAQSKFLSVYFRACVAGRGVGISGIFEHRPSLVEMGETLTENAIDMLIFQRVVDNFTVLSVFHQMSLF